MIYLIHERVEINKLYFQSNSYTRLTARCLNNIQPNKRVNDVNE